MVGGGRVSASRRRKASTRAEEHPVQTFASAVSSQIVQRRRSSAFDAARSSARVNSAPSRQGPWAAALDHFRSRASSSPPCSPVSSASPRRASSQWISPVSSTPAEARASAAGRLAELPRARAAATQSLRRRHRAPLLHDSRSCSTSATHDHEKSRRPARPRPDYAIPRTVPRRPFLTARAPADSYSQRRSRGALGSRRAEDGTRSTRASERAHRAGPAPGPTPNSAMRRGLPVGAGVGGAPPSGRITITAMPSSAASASCARTRARAVESGCTVSNRPLAERRRARRTPPCEEWVTPIGREGLLALPVDRPGRCAWRQPGCDLLIVDYLVELSRVSRPAALPASSARAPDLRHDPRFSRRASSRVRRRS